jgi:hypothetical protein
MGKSRIAAASIGAEKIAATAGMNINASLMQF